MARLKTLKIKGYRSIRDEVEIHFPEGKPLILLGPNNAGKSNIVRALDLLLGELWPGSRNPEDHDYWGRDPSGSIEIAIKIEGHSTLNSLQWRSTSGEITFNGTDKNGYEKKYISNEERHRLFAMVIEADRRLGYHLSYQSKWTLMSKVMRRFHEAISDDEKTVANLKSSFHEIVDTFKNVPDFLKFSDALGAYFDAFSMGMGYSLEVDFSAYDPTNYFHSLRLIPKEGDEPRSLDELGTGQEQLLALALAHAYAKAFYGGLILIVEEPEAHLHPLAQRWLAQHMRQLAEDGLQIIITTHSPAFLSIEGLEGLVLVRKDSDGATYTLQLDSASLAEHAVGKGAPPEKVNQSTIIPFYAAAATEEILSGLFANKVVLVEGPTEALALPIYLSKAGMDVLREGIAVIPVHGKGNLAKWYRFFTAYRIPTYVIFDNDAKNDTDGIKRADVLKALGVEESGIPDLTSIEDWVIESRFAMFGKDFETTFRKFIPGYSKLEEEAKQQGLQGAKPLIARYVAERLEFGDEEQAVRERLEELKDRLLYLEPASEAIAPIENGIDWDDPPF
ncbi:ATP-dependent nuclease [Oceanithermus sp.]